MGREDIGEAGLYLGEVHGRGLWVGCVGDTWGLGICVVERISVHPFYSHGCKPILNAI